MKKGKDTIINLNGSNWTKFISDTNNYQTFNYFPFNNRNQFPLLYL